MKFWIIPLLAMVSTALANETVEIGDGDLKVCKRNGYNGCCNWDDCPHCGFYQRCCYKPDSVPSDSGECKCGVDSYPQGDCY
ncbi:hypothetical protein NW768_002767 [Fusarium equiseti]|uniref:Uncharacterized protein n=1 Tax=Fusarium equiseti TaxID=61235 RepID=A0ABQ8RKB8_FUSEQ|nr:hypothetical protein NW768_002767 [Fusarium equiseti]